MQLFWGIFKHCVTSKGSVAAFYIGSKWEKRKKARELDNLVDCRALFTPFNYTVKTWDWMEILLQEFEYKVAYRNFSLILRGDQRFFRWNWRVELLERERYFSYQTKVRKWRDGKLTFLKSRLWKTDLWKSDLLEKWAFGILTFMINGLWYFWPSEFWPCWPLTFLKTGLMKIDLLE